MTLYYEDEQATIEAIKKHGPVAVLSGHAQMALCDRSIINGGLRMSLWGRLCLLAPRR